jgi:hypothetical protein
MDAHMPTRAGHGNEFTRSARGSCPAVAGPAPYGYAFPPRPGPPRLGDEAEIPCAVPLSPAHCAAMSGASSRSRPSLSLLMTVTDVQGACAHAAAFGALEAQTLEEAWTLTAAALEAADGEGS